MKKTQQFAAFLLIAILANCSYAFDLQITEIWMGNEPGENLTQDWFEITNYGAVAYDASVDGPLYFDDESFDPGTADLMIGISVIEPGEAVVFIDGDDGTGGFGNLVEFVKVWAPVKSPLPQLGSYMGSGLGQGGDAVGVWVGAPVGAPTFTGTYPDATFAMGGSYDLVLNEFSVDGNASMAVTTIRVNDIGQPAIGSPGMVAPIPEPAAGMMLLLGGLYFAGSRRR